MTGLSLIKIAITGQLGSGKSIVGKKLASHFGIAYYSTGNIQRKLAAEKNLTTLEFNQLAEKSREIDDEIDGFSKSLNHKQHNFVIDSRLAWYFIPSAFKIFLQVDHQEAASRIMNDKDRTSETYITLAETVNAIDLRQKSEQERYLNLYGVKLYDTNNYHLVMDTTKRTIDDTVNSIVDHWKKFSKGNLTEFPIVVN